MTIRGGRFYKFIGYLNQQHHHTLDFHDAPLIYRGIFGNQYFDDGVRATYVAPTDLYVELGLEAFAGGKYPAGGDHSNVGVWTGFVNFGGDLGISHSWQAGLSYLTADDIVAAANPKGIMNHPKTAISDMINGLESRSSGLAAMVSL